MSTTDTAPDESSSTITESADAFKTYVDAVHAQLMTRYAAVPLYFTTFNLPRVRIAGHFTDPETLVTLIEDSAPTCVALDDRDNAVCVVSWIADAVLYMHVIRKESSAG